MDELLAKHRLSKARVERFLESQYTTVTLGVFNCTIREEEDEDAKLKALSAYISHMNDAALDPVKE